METLRDIPTIIEQILHLRPLDSVTYPIDIARDVISASGGRVTWIEAGATWARLTPSTPGVEYPAL